MIRSFRSSVDVHSETFADNAASMAPLLDRLRAALEASHSDGSARAQQRYRQRGCLFLLPYFYSVVFFLHILLLFCFYSSFSSFALLIFLFHIWRTRFSYLQLLSNFILVVVGFVVFVVFVVFVDTAS